MFQFHNGTIKTHFQHRFTPSQFSFQFHNGTIKTETPGDIEEIELCFNSITVQLRPLRMKTQVNWKLVSIP